MSDLSIKYIYRHTHSKSSLTSTKPIPATGPCSLVAPTQFVTLELGGSIPLNYTAKKKKKKTQADSPLAILLEIYINVQVDK